MLALELAVRFLLRLGLLPVLPQPNAAHSRGGDRQPALPQLVGDANLSEGRLFDGQRDNDVVVLLAAKIRSWSFWCTNWLVLNKQ